MYRRETGSLLLLHKTRQEQLCSHWTYRIKSLGNGAHTRHRFITWQCTPLTATLSFLFAFFYVWDRWNGVRYIYIYICVCVCVRVYVYRYFAVYNITMLCYKSEGCWFDPSWCQWIFHWYNPSDSTVALESIQPLTEMSTRSISWG